MPAPASSHPLAQDPNWKAAYQKTRKSLIERLENWEDQRNWDDFYKTYWRLIYSVAIKAGLRSEEAFDVVQETILGIAKQSKQKKYNPEAGSFKSWLMNMTRWRIADQFRKRAKDTASAGIPEDDRKTAVLDRFADPDPNPLDKLWNEEWQRNIAETALTQVKTRVSPKQFQIFDCYVIKGWPVKRVMAELGVSMAQVYLSKHRIGGLIKKEVEGLRSNLFEEALFAPGIQDYQMVCKIGGGSYGQVWMALSVTGAYRAVKIVAREDFRLEKTFEREFEGIKKFEPISRSHDGLVDILHVGRSYEENFYFYVMELADDRHGTPGTIDPYKYQPRTLRSDIVSDTQVEIATCASVGAELADALHHLHTKGLSHRDVKPSNVIFVDGSPKLADIGLVAETGQQTFVGTEGFVPPEGPGTPQADIYSLGMVLYELATGKDRLDFPELPDDFTFAQNNRESWHRLNQIICQCCAPDRRKRFRTALDVQQALASVAKKRVPVWKSKKAQLIASCAIAVTFATASITSSLRSGNTEASQGDAQTSTSQAEAPIPSAKATLPPNSTASAAATTSTPFNADDVIDDDRSLSCNARGAIAYTVEGREISPLPLQMHLLKRQKINVVIIDAQGYQSAKVETHRFTTNQPHIILKKQPSLQRGWENFFGMVFRYDPVKPRHITKWPVGRQMFERFLQTQEGTDTQLRSVQARSLFPGFDGKDSELILTDPPTAQAFCQWLSSETPEHLQYEPQLESVFAGPSHTTSLKLLYCQIPLQKQG